MIIHFKVFLLNLDTQFLVVWLTVVSPYVKYLNVLCKDGNNFNFYVGIKSPKVSYEGRIYC